MIKLHEILNYSKTWMVHLMINGFSKCFKSNTLYKTFIEITPISNMLDFFRAIVNVVIHLFHRFSYNYFANLSIFITDHFHNKIIKFESVMDHMWFRIYCPSDGSHSFSWLRSSTWQPTIINLQQQTFHGTSSLLLPLRQQNSQHIF